MYDIEPGVERSSIFTILCDSYCSGVVRVILLFAFHFLWLQKAYLTVGW